jgi:hypothetical protein
MVVPRTSRYVIELSAEERDELERRAREVTAPWRDVQRARMIIYAAEGMADSASWTARPAPGTTSSR